MIADRMSILFFLYDSMQPGYLRQLLPGSAPVHPDTLEDVLDGEVSSFVLTTFFLWKCA